MKKKRILTLALALLICLSVVNASGFAAVAPAPPETSTPAAATQTATPTVTAAQNLNILGLFQGVGTNADGTPNFELDRAPTRAEAITLFVRLLGKESEALRGSWTTPFTDVADWAKPYIGYAYENGLANGVSLTEFGGSSPATATQYLTFVLRSLGYISGEDFEWNRAWVLSDNLGFTDGRFNAATTTFTRGDAAAVSFDALSAKFKGSDKQLYVSLIEAGIFSETAAKNVGLVPSIAPVAIILSQTTASLDVGKMETITAEVSPVDAENKTVTWTSSNPSIATVSSTGVVTGVAEGAVNITARTSNGLSATCAIKVVQPAPFTVPLLDHEYGPMMIVDRISDRLYYTNNVSSLVFTTYKKYDFVTYYYITVNVQGVTDDTFCDISVHFFDASGRLLAEERILKSVTKDVPYNMLVETFKVEADVLERAVRIEFFSKAGLQANSGLPPSGGADSSGGTGNTGGGRDDSSQTQTQTPAYSVPVLNNEYGPFTVTNYYSSGSFWGSMAISSFVFTKCELTNIGKYNLAYSVQGTASGNNNSFYLYFYDSGNRVLDKMLINLNVAKDQSFNTVDTHYVDKDVVENAVRIAFYSYSGEAENSTSGGSSTTPPPAPDTSTSTPPPTPGTSTPSPDPSDKYETYYGYSGIPKFDQFTASSSTIASIKTNMEAYLYISATESEIDTYVGVLKECGFETWDDGNYKMYVFTRGTVGDSAYREVRIAWSASPAGAGYAVNVIIARILPTNQQ